MNKEDLKTTVKAHLTREEIKSFCVEDIVAPPPAYDIPLSEFGELPDYTAHTLYYYVKDKTLVDEEDNVIDDIDEIVGKTLMKKIIKDEDVDTCYVRNDSKKCDYEIVKENGAFTDYEHYSNDWDDDDG